MLTLPDLQYMLAYIACVYISAPACMLGEVCTGQTFHERTVQ